MVVACSDSVGNWNSMSKSLYHVVEETRFCCCQVGVRLIGLGVRLIGLGVRLIGLCCLRWL